MDEEFLDLKRRDGKTIIDVDNEQQLFMTNPCWHIVECSEKNPTNQGREQKSK